MSLRSRFAAFTLALAGIAGLVATPMAHAGTTPAGFKMHVLDPPSVPGGPDYITGLSFQINFAPCAPNELPDGITAQGCFLGFNRSAYDWTGLQFTFQNNGALNGQPPDCSLNGKDDIFARTSCAFTNAYVLNFDAGIIPNTGSASTFFVTEDGIDPALFGTGDAVVTSYTTGTSNTPEPATFVLLGTGLLLVGWVATHRSA